MILKKGQKTELEFNILSRDGYVWELQPNFNYLIINQRLKDSKFKEDTGWTDIYTIQSRTDDYFIIEAFYKRPFQSSNFEDSKVLVFNES